MTMMLEWEILGSVPTVKLMDHFKIDSRFYKMHIGIDNASHGHGALARDAVKLYLDQLYSTGGEEAVQRQWERIWNGYVAFQTVGNLGEDLRSLVLNPPTVHQRLVRVIEAKAPRGSFNHAKKMLGGTYINNLFDNPEAFLKHLSASELVVKGSPKRSTFFQLLSWDGPMYKVFNDEEIDLWRDWIESLGEPHVEPFTFSPLESMVALVEAQRTQLDTLLLQDRSITGPQPGNQKHIVERSAAWWALQPADSLLAALAAPANRAVDGLGADGVPEDGNGQAAEKKTGTRTKPAEAAARTRSVATPESGSGSGNGGDSSNGNGSVSATGLVHEFAAALDGIALAGEPALSGKTPQRIVEEWVRAGWVR
ncbi:hypothetical protein ACIA98_36210 [Streptomyces sp. NPDC051366]|uniref:hypothetical protein n=1 Tax=Streptomyces sp. NPDC051366 TaxID=3365652 RepID=UPI00379F3567